LQLIINVRTHLPTTTKLKVTFIRNYYIYYNEIFTPFSNVRILSGNRIVVHEVMYYWQVRRQHLKDVVGFEVVQVKEILWAENNHQG